MEETKFIWAIQNFNFLPIQRGQAIKSPTFDVSGLSSIFIELYPNGDILDPHGTYSFISLNKQNIAHFHVTCHCTFKKGNLRLSFEPEKDIGNAKWMFPIYKPEFVKISKQNTSPQDLSPSDFQAADGVETILIITCFFRKNGYLWGRKNLLEEEKTDMAALACDMKHLYLNEELSDLILVVEAKEYPVHQAILQARAPKLFDEIKHKLQTSRSLDQNLVDKNKITLNLNPKVMELLLNYIYSGELPSTNINVPYELYVAAELYSLNELKQMLYYNPTVINASTVVKFDHRVFSWALSNITMPCKLKDEKLFTPVFAGGVVPNSDFKLCCGIINKEGKESIEILVQRLNPDMSRPILIKGKIFCIRFPDLKQDVEHLFTSDTEWVFPTFLQLKTKGSELYLGNGTLEDCLWKCMQLVKEICLTCEMYISSEVVSDIMETGFASKKHDEEELENSKIINLCHDLGQLYNIFLPKLSDVTLKAECVNFPAHKAILAARSPVFERMFTSDMQEKEKGIVEIVDIEHTILYMMLTYIYSAKLDVLNFDSAFKLYSASDKYEVMCLRKKCAVFLTKGINVENVCDVFVLSDMHGDKDMKKEAVNFMLENMEAVLKGAEWQKVIEGHPRLATEFLKEATAIVLKKKRNLF